MSNREVEAGRAYILIRLRNQVSAGLLAVERQMMNFGRTLAYQSGAFALALKAPSIWALKLAGDFEKAEVRLTHFVGSADKAKSILKELQDFDIIAPMDFTALVDATQLLLGFGDSADAVVKHVKQLGDISGGDMLRFQRLALALGQVITAGNLMGTEARQFAESGWNPLESLAKMTGKTMAEMREMMGDRKITPEMVFAALDHATGPLGRFNNLLVDQAKTLPGLVSVLWSYIKLTAMEVGFTILDDAKELVKVAVNAMKWVRDWVKENKQLVGTIMRLVAVVGAAAGLMFAFGMAAMALGNVLSFVRNSLWLIMTPIGMIFKTMFNMPGLLMSGFGFLFGLLAKLASMMAFLFMTPAGWGIIAGVLGLSLALVLFKDRLKQIYEGIKSFAEGIAWQMEKIKRIVGMGLFGHPGIQGTGIIAAFKAGDMKTAYVLTMLTIKAAALAMAAGIADSFQNVIDWIGRTFPSLKAFADLFGVVSSSIAMALMTGQWQAAGNQMLALIDSMLTALKFKLAKLIAWLKYIIKDIFLSMLDELVALAPTLASWAGLTNKSIAKQREQNRGPLEMLDVQERLHNWWKQWVIGDNAANIKNNAGGLDLQGMAQEAYKALYEALTNQKVADKAKENAAGKAASMLSGVEAATGAFGGVGTFSTFGATLLGAYNAPLQQIARNTEKANRYLAEIARREERQKNREMMAAANEKRRKAGQPPFQRFNDFRRSQEFFAAGGAG